MCRDKAPAKRFRIDGERMAAPLIVLLTIVLITLLDTVGEDYTWLLLDYLSKF